MDATWDESKNLANRKKHGLSFDEAAGLFSSDRDFYEFFDGLYPGGEERYVAIGEIEAGVIAVVYIDQDDEAVRIISARYATPREVLLYQHYMDQAHDGHS